MPFLRQVVFFILKLDKLVGAKVNTSTVTLRTGKLLLIGQENTGRECCCSVGDWQHLASLGRGIP